MSLVLKRFQTRVRDAIVSIINNTANKIEEAPEARAKIAAAQGCILLESPTASGKTLTIASALEQLRFGIPSDSPDRRKVAWFWFAPFSEVVGQTIASIREDVNLSVRDPREDRERMVCKSGDVFVSTGQSVSAKDAKSRLARRGSEDTPSFDDFVAELRDDGYYIGAVVDEAHHNFNTAPQARSFYIDVLKPDFTIMATATPNDADLAQFRKFAGISQVNHLSVSRSEVVLAGLNKYGVKAFYFKGSSEKDDALVDYNQIAIFAAVRRHNQIKQALAEEGISLTPLLLVQVENYKESVERARDLLMEAGIPSDAIAVHTADEPDKDLRAIVHDESKQALIFKMAVATGFDVPRAWTLVSMRASRSVQFGLQVIGRIMRVHPRLQEREIENKALLDYGHVFLANAEGQTGLSGAADEISAIVSEIQTITDHVQIIEINDQRLALTDPDGGFFELLGTEPPKGGAPVLPAPEEDAPGFVGALFGFENLANGQLEEAKRSQQQAKAFKYEYPLRTGIGVPLALDREEVGAEMDGMVDCIAQRIDFGPNVLMLVGTAQANVEATEEDLFSHLRVVEEQRVAISVVKVAAATQMAFRFNDSLDPRDLKAALLERLRKEIHKAGYPEQTPEVLRRTLGVALFRYKNLLKDACKVCMSRSITVRKADPIPGTIGSDSPLDQAHKSVYAVFGPRMNTWERSFATVLDKDDSGTILWWMRNIENASWACKIIRPSGQAFFPDFVIGVAGRKTSDNIGLAEVKERIEDFNSGEKTRVPHKTYGTALMVTWNKPTDTWEVVDFVANLDRNQPIKPFAPNDLTLLHGGAG
jgi:superfamily II DNA or RNA helicase